MRKKVKIIIGLLVVLVIIITAGFMTKKWWAGADVTLTGSGVKSDLQKYYLNGTGFVPGELIVKVKTTSDSEKTTLVDELKNQSYLEGTATAKEIVPELGISPETYKIKFDVPKTNLIQNTEQTLSVYNWQTVKNALEQAKMRLGYLTYEDRIGLKQTLAIRNELKNNPRISAVYLNHVYQPFSLPNDTYINPSKDGTTWSTGAFGQSYEDLWGLKQTGVDKAWEKSTGEGVIVAVVDTGVDFTHEDLRDNILTQENDPTRDHPSGQKPSNHMICYNAIENNDKCMDDVGHGTHVAGTIAALKNNNRGIAGIAPKTKIMPVKVMANYGGTEEWIVKGIKFAADNGAKIINMSLGGYGQSELINEAIEYASQKGVITVVAAGNSAMDAGVFNPASNPNVITVGASNESKQLTFFSNYGESVEVVAPGGGKQIGSLGSTWEEMIWDNPNINNILSLKSAKGSIGGNLTVGEKYLRLAGTSMATPFVAGTVALIASLHPDYNADQIKSVLYKSATDITDPNGDGNNYIGWDAYSGYGLINPEKAMAIEASSLPVAEINGSAITAINTEDLAENYEIKGTAAGSNFKQYTLSWAYINLEKLDYYPQKFNQVSSSQSKVQNGTLGVIDTQILKNPEKPFVMIKLEVEGQDGLKKFALQEILTSKNEAKNFPKLGPTNEHIWENLPTDLDNDGKKEMIYVDWYMNLHGLDDNGTKLDNWESIKEQNRGLVANLFYQQPMAITDQNNKKLIILPTLEINAPKKTMKLFLNAYDAKEGLRSGPVWSTLVQQGSNNINTGEVIGGIKFITTIKKNNEFLTALSYNDHLKFYDSKGKLVKDLDRTTFWEAAVGDFDDKQGEDIAVTGFRDINGELRQGLFVINLEDWQFTDKLVLNARDSNKYYLYRLVAGDLDKDNKLDFALGQGDITEMKIITIANNGRKFGEKSYNANLWLSFEVPSGATMNDLTDVDNDGTPEIGVYNLNDNQYEYLNKKTKIVKKIKLGNTSYKTLPWTADINKDNIPEILLFEETNNTPGFNDNYRIYNVNGERIANYALGGWGAQNALWKDGKKIRTFITSWNPEDLFLHKFEFEGSDKKLDWPMYQHDARRTNNWQAEQID